MVVILQGSAAGAVATLATSFKSLKVSRQVSDKTLERQASAVSNDTQVSKVGAYTSEGLEKSASSAAGLIETMSTPVSSENQSSGNVTILDAGGDPSSSLLNHLSEMSVHSEMLRVSEPSSTASKDLAGLVHDTGSAVDVTSEGHGESVIFPSVVESPSDKELEKAASKSAVIEDEIVHVEEALEIEKIPQQTELSDPRYNADGNEQLDDVAENASYVQIIKDHANDDATGIEHRDAADELVFVATSNNDVDTTKDAGYSEDIETPDIIDKDITDAVEGEVNKTSVQLLSEVPPTASIEVPEDVAEDVICDEIALEQLPDSPAYIESEAVVRAEPEDLKEDFSADLPASQASVSAFDVLPLSEIPSVLDKVEAETEVFEQKISLDSSVAERDQEMHVEWPPLPTDEELKISEAELEQSSVGDFMVSELPPTSPQKISETEVRELPPTLPQKISEAKLEQSSDFIVSETMDVELHPTSPQKISEAEQDQETHVEWPSLPSDEQLKISEAELEQSSDFIVSEDKDVELPPPSPQKISEAEQDQETHVEWPSLPSDEQLKISEAELDQPSSDDFKLSEDKEVELAPTSPQKISEAELEQPSSGDFVVSEDKDIELPPPSPQKISEAELVQSNDDFKHREDKEMELHPTSPQKISEAELEQPSSGDFVDSEDEDLELHPPSPQHHVPLDLESGTLAVGASEKVLTNAAHLRDESMHRFK